MDLNRLAKKAKQVIDERGGMESLKGDADELRRIADGQGTLAEKAKAAAAAIKTPGEAAAEQPTHAHGDAPRPNPDVADVHDPGSTPGA